MKNDFKKKDTLSKSVSESGALVSGVWLPVPASRLILWLSSSNDTAGDSLAHLPTRFPACLIRGVVCCIPVQCGRRSQSPSGSGWNSVTRRLRLKVYSWGCLHCRAFPLPVASALHHSHVRSVSTHAKRSEDPDEKPNMRRKMQKTRHHFMIILRSFLY